MGIRRRRRKLTTLMSRLDQRVKAVELRPVSFLTSDQVAAAVEAGEAVEVPESVVSANAPFQWRRVEDAWLYPKALTGLAEDRVEIYSQSDLNLAVGERLHVSGVHWASNLEVDSTGDNFTVKQVDTPPWTGRSYRHDPTQDQLAGVTITNTYSYKPDTQAPTTWASRRRFQTRRLVDYFSITGTTVTLTMNATHHFKADDIIFVDIFNEDSRAYGLDGLFKIDSVTDTTIVYTLAAGVVTPTGNVTPDDPVYVFPVARKYAAVGSTWADTTTDKIYFWDGIRWVDSSTASLPGDGDPPNPPTAFNLTETPKVAGADYQAYSEIVATWTPPTTSESGNPITDLLGYIFNWRESTSAPWGPDVEFEDPTLTTFTFGPAYKFLPGNTYYFKLRAYDSGNEKSNAVTDSITTTQKTGDHTNYQPTDPVATSRLGTITVTWDGNLKTGPSTTIAAQADIVVMKIYVSTTPGFTPGPANLALSTRVFGADGGFDVLTDLNYNTSYYIRISLVDTSGVEGQYSEQVTAQVSPLVDTDLVYAALSEWPFNGGVVPAGALANGAINASTLFGPGVVVQNAIAANAIGADQIAAGAIIAGKIGADAVTSNTIATGAITAGKIDTNAVTADKIDAGAVTAVKIDAGAVEADKIDAGAVTAGKLAADLVLSSVIRTAPAGSQRIEIRGAGTGLGDPGIFAFDGLGGTKFRFYGNGDAYLDDVYIDTARLTGSLTASGSITSTGGNIQTGSSGKRVVLDGGTDSLVFYGSDNAEKGEVSAGSTNLVLNGNSGIAFQTGGVTIFSVNSSGISLSPGETFNSNLDVVGIVTATQSIQADTFVRSGVGTGNWATMGSNGTITSTGSITSGSTVVVGTMTISTTNPIVRWNGSGLALNVTSSDRRIKSQIETISEGLSIVNQLNPVTFDSLVDDIDKRLPGFIAQEVQEVFSSDLGIVGEISVESVETDIDLSEGPLKTLDYQSLIPYLTKAIQELSQQTTELQARITSLEGQ
jgi:hypothetical protein